jgi:hypothetical protein
MTLLYSHVIQIFALESSWKYEPSSVAMKEKMDGCICAWLRACVCVCVCVMPIQLAPVTRDTMTASTWEATALDPRPQQESYWRLLAKQKTKVQTAG